LACAKSASRGIKVADVTNPKATNHQSGPELNPKKGGRIKFPAPKNAANMAKPNINVSLVLFIFQKNICFQDSLKNKSDKKNVVLRIFGIT